MSRIGQLRRRDWRRDAEAFVDALTAILKTPEGQQRLRLGQTGALLELAVLRGLIEQGRVGTGKTLVLALAPMVLGCVRPLIMTTGGLLEETKAHIDEARKHWRIPADIEYLSYTALSNFPRKGRSLRELWAGLGPDCIGCDEFHNLANVTGAAVAKQVHEWKVEEPDTVIVGASGSFDLDGMPSYAHLFDWALGEGSPLPRTPHEVAAWSSVIDDGEELHASDVCSDLGIARGSSLEVVRDAYRDRLLSTEGVIVDDTPFTGVPLTVQEHLFDPGLDEHFQRLRELGQRPDGVDVMPDDATPDLDLDGRGEPDRVAGGRIAETARQLASGFFYKMWPPAPPEWLKARRRYFGYVRASIEDGRFMTEAQARKDAIDNNLKVWTEWAALQPTFTPQFHTVWLSDALVEWCREWGRQGPGIIWTEHVALGPHLQEKLGWTYYGGKGRSKDGRKITDGPRPSPQVIIASRRANGTGRNLQHQWNRCAFIQLPGRPYLVEQTMGRIHREGQTRACHIDVLMRCSEDWRARAKVLAGAEKTNSTFYSQKACTIPWAKVSRPARGWAYQ